MSSVGIDANTGRVLIGWPHIVQSIGKVLMTETGSRVERRDYGSGVPALIDTPMTRENVVDFIMAVAEALEPRVVNGMWYGEPRVQLLNVRPHGTADGELLLFLDLIEIPNGHLGDFTPANRREQVFVVDGYPGTNSSLTQ
ncbi:GPW/gp25 [Roseibium sp. TrichSKD4]|uniref:GPW/gp25 family protein n=1 Tax=Roseibium sp. TrichSKD4 TaxID=744980 RepID=UPI0001E56CD7|nr:GPW/gp25 [Roseibium sp. TrichSKD4]EFO32130.1 GPW/gp25 [Roseibium sp. TrichSKD4]